MAKGFKRVLFALGLTVVLALSWSAGSASAGWQVPPFDDTPGGGCDGCLYAGSCYSVGACNAQGCPREPVYTAQQCRRPGAWSGCTTNC